MIQVVLSVDRFVLIAPFKYIQSLKKLRNCNYYVPVVTTVVWMSALMLTIPTLVHSEYDKDEHYCLQSWPEPEYQ